MNAGQRGAAYGFKLNSLLKVCFTRYLNCDVFEFDVMFNFFWGG